MPRKETEVKLYRVTYTCDEPGCDGELTHVKQRTVGDTMANPHKCRKCGVYKDLPCIYPCYAPKPVESALPDIQTEIAPGIYHESS